MIDATNYTITVRKGEFDGEQCFEARVVELPDLTEYADSFEETYALAIDSPWNNCGNIRRTRKSHASAWLRLDATAECGLSGF